MEGSASEQAEEERRGGKQGGRGEEWMDGGEEECLNNCEGKERPGSERRNVRERKWVVCVRELREGRN